jgi:hypothetical protein
MIEEQVFFTCSFLCLYGLIKSPPFCSNNAFPIAAFGKIFNRGEHLGRSIVRAIRNAMANNGLEVKGVEDESK